MSIATKDVQTILATLRQRDSERHVHVRGAGQDILSPDELITAGVPTDMVESLTTTYYSPLWDVQNAIFVDGKVVTSLRGVHRLRLYEAVCRALHLTYAWKFIRDAQARVCHDALQHWVDGQAAA